MRPRARSHRTRAALALARARARACARSNTPPHKLAHAHVITYAHACKRHDQKAHDQTGWGERGDRLNAQSGEQAEGG